MLLKPEHEYEPIVTGVTVNDWLYPSVTISPWPGASVTITLSTRGLSEEDAQVRALEQWKRISALILEGGT